MLGELGLSDAQREQVKQLTQQHREQARALFERVRAARAAERQATEAMPFSEPQLRAALQALGEVETELAVQQARLRNDIYAVLTPDQQAKLKELRADREARIKKRQERFQQRRQQRQPRPQA
jgi:Spy/CpxP family protein refolding chaperone